jgi:F-type H+-transporting ATPase subunit delta
VSDRSSARRYAAALFDVAAKARSEEAAGQQLTALAALIRDHAELTRVLETPAIPTAAKKNLVLAVAKTAGVLSSEVERLISLLADRDRLPLVPDVASAYVDRLNQEKKIVPAEIVTAVPLTPDHRAAIAAALGRASGAEITLTERVDPSIIGGVVARVGSVVYDGSVARQLERLRQKLTA